MITSYPTRLATQAFAIGGELVPGSKIWLACWDGGFAECPEDEREASAPWETDGDLPSQPREDEEWKPGYPDVDQADPEDA